MNLASGGGFKSARQVLEFLHMVMPRNRQRTSLEDRLLEFAKEARTAATLVVPGREQDELLRKARKAEMLACDRQIGIGRSAIVRTSRSSVH